MPTLTSGERSEDLMETVEFPQLYVYDVCLHKFGARHEWVAFIDADEFLVLTGGAPSLPALLRRCALFCQPLIPSPYPKSLSCHCCSAQVPPLLQASCALLILCAVMCLLRCRGAPGVAGNLTRVVAF